MKEMKRSKKTDAGQSNRIIQDEKVRSISYAYLDQTGLVMREYSFGGDDGEIRSNCRVIESVDVGESIWDAFDVFDSVASGALRTVSSLCKMRRITIHFSTSIGVDLSATVIVSDDRSTAIQWSDTVAPFKIPRIDVGTGSKYDIVCKSVTEITSVDFVPGVQYILAENRRGGIKWT